MIDYIGFTVPVSAYARPSELYDLGHWLGRVGIDGAVIGFWAAYARDNTPAQISRPPYKQAYRYGGIGLSHAFSGQDNALIEISGTGVQLLRDNELLGPLLRTMPHDRATRLDLCGDYPAQTPYDLLDAHGVRKAIRTKSIVESNTGVTIYLGSRKSDSFCRVYEYAEPHPRAGIGRIEHQLKSSRARMAVLAMQNGMSDSELYHAYNARVFDNPPEYDADSPAPTLDGGLSRAKSSGLNLNWLHKQVYPALRRAIGKGEISIQDIVTALGPHGGKNETR